MKKIIVGMMVLTSVSAFAKNVEVRKCYKVNAVTYREKTDSSIKYMALDLTDVADGDRGSMMFDFKTKSILEKTESLALSALGKDNVELCLSQRGEQAPAGEQFSADVVEATIRSSNH